MEHIKEILTAEETARDIIKKAENESQKIIHLAETDGQRRIQEVRDSLVTEREKNLKIRIKEAEKQKIKILENSQKSAKKITTTATKNQAKAVKIVNNYL